LGPLGKGRRLSAQKEYASETGKESSILYTGKIYDAVEESGGEGDKISLINSPEKKIGFFGILYRTRGGAPCRALGKADFPDRSKRRGLGSVFYG